jgi:lichenan operon transcriptional antiterminator
LSLPVLSFCIIPRAERKICVVFSICCFLPLSPLAFYDLADRLYCSESTLNDRLHSVRKRLQEAGLRLVHKNGFLSIQGSELNKRRLMRSLIYESIPTPDSQPIYQYASYFPGMDVGVVQNIVLSSLQDAGYLIQAPYASSLNLGILICLYRMQHGIHATELAGSPSSTSEEAVLAENICRRFHDHYDVVYTKNDCLYIASLFQGQIIKNKAEPVPQLSAIEEKVDAILTEILESQLYALDPTPWIHGLAMHVYELVRRSETGNYVVNESYISLKENSPFIYDVAVRFSKELEKEFHISFPDDEIGFLAVHIGIILANNKSVSAKVSILLVADNYHGLAEMLQKRLLETYPDSISVTIASQDPMEGIRERYDLILTTRHLSIIGGSVLEISPFYSVMDRTRVNEMIASCRRRKEESLHKQNLMSYMTPQLFFIRKDIHTEEESIRFLSEKLIEFGAVDASFTDSVLEREALSPTCFFNTFAIPHALEMNANKTIFAILINKDGISWGSSKIRLCMMIAIARKDRKTFSETYSGVVEILTDSARAANLINSTTFAQFVLNFMAD